MRLSKFLAVAAICAVVAGMAPLASAYGPVLSLSNNGANMVLTVSGATPNAAIILSYTPSGSSLATTVNNFGYTDGSGNYTTNISSNAYGLTGASQVYVTVAGQQSNIVSGSGSGYYGGGYGGCGYYGCSGCTYNCGNTLVLNQTSVSLSVGQSSIVTATNNYYGNLYVSSNSSPTAATATASGSGVTIYGQAAGSTTLTICANGNGSCATVYVTVSGVLGASNYQVTMRDNYFSPTTITVPVGGSVTWYNYGTMAHTVTADNGNFNSGTVNPGGSFTWTFNTPGTYWYHCQFHGSSGGSGMSGSVTVTGSGGIGGLTLSQTSVNLSVGQTSYVTASMPIYNPAFYISNNSNNAVVTASVSGSQVSLFGLAAGSSTVTVCTTGGSACASVFVTVSGSGSGSGSVWFSPTNPSLFVGQSLAVSINSAVGYGYSSANSAIYYYISSNSNPSVVSANIVGTVLNLYANQNGSSNITVCSSALGFCGTLSATVGGSGSGSLSLSQTNVSLSLGQSTTVTAYNNSGSSVYVSNNTNPSVVSTSVSGNVVYLTSVAAGSSSVTICGGNIGNCGTVYVTVTGGGNGALSFSPTNPTLAAGQTLNVAVYNNYASYGLYVASNSNSNAVGASISGNNVVLSGYNSGTASIDVCTNGSSQCGYLYVTVTGSSYGSNIYFTPSSLSLAIGQSASVTVYGPYSYNFTISSNSSPNVVSATLQNNLLTVTGMNSGYTTLSVCQNGISQCGSLGVTVNNGYGYGGGGYGSGTLSLSQTSASLSVGQTMAITAYNYGGSVYVSNNTNPNIVSASVAGNQISLYGLANGSATVTVCGYNASQCAMIYATVAGSGLGYSGGGGGNVLGTSVYSNGALISENGTVYIVYKNTKSGFVSAAVFSGFGFSFNKVVYVSNSGLADSGFVISTANASHPWGSWIKNGRTIYFVHDSGLIPVPDWSTFVNNGGQASLVVSANHYDFSLPILSTMTLGDPRLN